MDTTQLAPLCASLSAEVRKQNTDFGLDEFFSYRPYGGNTSISITGGSVPYTGYVDDKNLTNILFKNPINDLEVKYTLQDLNLTGKAVGTKKLVSDPMDEAFNFVAQTFSTFNYVTPKTLPPLPIEPQLDPSCLLPVKENGSHSGAGTAQAPYIVCSWNELGKIVTSASASVDRTSTYLALGKSIDLAGVAIPLMDLNGIYELDGKSYRVKNALFVDAENSVSIFKNLRRIRNLVFQNNSLTGKSVSPFSLNASGVASNVYSYDNTFVGEIVGGAGRDTDFCHNIYTKNQIRYSGSGSGVCAGRGLTVQSFSQDKVNYIGLPGASSSYLGVGPIAANSGSASEISGGASIGGVAGSFCYKCYSNVVINTSNSIYVGGILVNMTLVGTIEVGESNAQIVVAGNGYAGGIAALMTDSFVDDFLYITNSNFDSFQMFKGKKFVHTNIVNSKFTGSISGTGTIGGAIGWLDSRTNLYLTNTQLTGVISGAETKGSILGRTTGQCVATDVPVVKTRNVSKNQTLPIIGKNLSGLPVNSSVEY